MNPDTLIAVPAFVQQVEAADSFEAVMLVTKQAVESCNWIIGKGTSRSVTEFGRTLQDVGDQLGKGPVFLARAKKTWDEFHDHPLRGQLSYTHFNVATSWGADAITALEWAADTGAGVKEMRAYRKTVLNPNASDEAEAEADEETTEEAPADTLNLAPASIDQKPDQLVQPNDAESMASAVREGSEYTPFRDMQGEAPAVLDDEPHIFEPTGHPPQSTREAVEDYLNNLSVVDLCEAIRAVDDGTDEEKAATLLSLAYELNPKLKPKPAKMIDLDQVEFPPILDTPECRDALSEWLQYKRTKKQAYKVPKSVNTLLQRFIHSGPAAFVVAVAFSIGQNYDGLYEDKQYDSRSNRGTGAERNRTAEDVFGLEDH